MAKKTTKKASKKTATKKSTARKSTARTTAKKAAKKTTKKTAGKSSAKKSKATTAKKTAKKATKATTRRGAEPGPSVPRPSGLARGAGTGRKVDKVYMAEVRKENDRLDRTTVKSIVHTADQIHRTILAGDKPNLKFPVRSLNNVSYSAKKGYLEIGRSRKERTLTVNTVKGFAQTLRMMGLSKELVESHDFATKRDVYYQSKNWNEARFNDQTESDTVMDDIEALFSVDDISREQLRFVPDEHGGAVAGQLIVHDPDLETGEIERIDCTRFGSGAYSIPSSVEHLSFETDAKFILAIETGGIFQRLQSHKYWRQANCILVSMAGVPTRSTRRFIRRLSEQAGIPVHAFVDCDPYGISNIYRTLKVGSGNAAHINKFFCVPWANFLGVTPDDIVKYDLPTHPLKDVDIKRAKDALKNDPFFQSKKRWSAALEQLLKMGVRAEQQALAKWGLNYVIDEYLPQKLAEPAKFLP
jgi:DNA topoisomerase-6 subunit A